MRSSGYRLRLPLFFRRRLPWWRMRRPKWSSSRSFLDFRFSIERRAACESGARLGMATEYFNVIAERFSATAEYFSVIAGNICVPAEYFNVIAECFIVMAEHFSARAERFFVIAESRNGKGGPQSRVDVPMTNRFKGL